MVAQGLPRIQDILNAETEQRPQTVHELVSKLQKVVKNQKASLQGPRSEYCKGYADATSDFVEKINDVLNDFLLSQLHKIESPQSPDPFANLPAHQLELPLFNKSILGDK